MSLTVGTVDIAVRLNTDAFNKQVQSAVNYTTKAFNSANVSKALQNQFKQVATTIEQTTRTMSNSMQTAISGAITGADNEIKSVQQKIRDTQKLIAAQERELSNIEKKAIKSNPRDPGSILDNNTAYQTILGSVDSSTYRLNQYKEELAYLQRLKQLELERNNAQKEAVSLSNAISKYNQQSDSLVKNIVSMKQYNDLLDNARTRTQQIREQATELAAKTGTNKNYILANNSEYQKQAQILSSLVGNSENIKRKILETNVANQSQLGIMDQLRLAMDVFKNNATEAGTQVRNINLDNFSNILSGIGTKLTSMGGNASKLGPIFTSIASSASKINPYVTAGIVGVKALTSVSSKLVTVFTTVASKVKEVTTTIVSKLSSAIKGITGQSTSFESAWSSAFNRLITLAGTLFSLNKIYNFVKESILAAGDMESAWLGLASISANTGNSFANAQKFIKEYTSDGLVTISDAVASYRNLIGAKYTEEQAQDIMNAFKDTAAFARQQGKTMSQAVKDATEGVKNQNSVDINCPTNERLLVA